MRVRIESTPAEASPPTWDRTSRGCDMEADREPAIKEIGRKWPPAKIARITDTHGSYRKLMGIRAL